MTGVGVAVGPAVRPTKRRHVYTQLTLCGGLVDVTRLLQSRFSLAGEPIPVQQLVPPEGAATALLGL